MKSIDKSAVPVEKAYHARILNSKDIIGRRLKYKGGYEPTTVDAQ